MTRQPRQPEAPRQSAGRPAKVRQAPPATSCATRPWGQDRRARRLTPNRRPAQRPAAMVAARP
eukprot:6348428-Alexandrium_andersonii.AAC.1